MVVGFGFVFFPMRTCFEFWGWLVVFVFFLSWVGVDHFMGWRKRT